MFFTNEKVKTLKEANVDLQSRIDELELEIKKLKNYNTTFYNTNDSNLILIEKLIKKTKELQDKLSYIEDNEEDLEYQKSQTELWKSNTEKACKTRDEYLLKLDAAKVEEEKAKTSYKIIKAENDVLSKSMDNIQPVLDENIKLKAEINTLKEIDSIRDVLAKNKDKEILELKAQVNKLMDTITEFKTKDPTVVHPNVIQPQVIEPTVLSSKK